MDDWKSGIPKMKPVDPGERSRSPGSNGRGWITLTIALSVLLGLWLFCMGAYLILSMVWDAFATGFSKL